MEKNTNNFILKRKIEQKNLRGFTSSDSVYAYVADSLIEVMVKPSWSNLFRSRLIKQIKETVINAKNMMILNLNHSNQYGHIYSEVFSEIFSVDDTYPEYDCILITKTPLMEKVIETFNLKLSDRIKFISSTSEEKYLLNFDKLEIVNHCPTSYINKLNNVANLKSIFHKQNPIVNKPKNFLLFCSRSSTSARHGRNITQQNENNIIEYLKEYAEENNLEFYFFNGEECDGSSVPISKQYEIFSNVEILVGLHGGVMSNLIFLDPAKKPKVIEFCPTKKKTFSRLFAGAIEVFAEYYIIPCILPTEVLKEIADEPDLQEKTKKTIHMLKKIDCTIDVAELKKILPLK